MEGSLRNLIRCTRVGAREEEGEEDVVDYEGAWYAAIEGAKGKGRKVRRLVVGRQEGAEDEDEERERGREEGQGAGLGKRRRWRV